MKHIWQYPLVGLIALSCVSLYERPVLAQLQPTQYMNILDRNQEIRLINQWKKQDAIHDVLIRQENQAITITVTVKRSLSQDRAKKIAETVAWQIKASGYDKPPEASGANSNHLGKGIYNYTVEVKSPSHELIEVGIKQADEEKLSWSLDKGKKLIGDIKEPEGAIEPSSQQESANQAPSKPWWQRHRSPKSWSSPDQSDIYSR